MYILEPAIVQDLKDPFKYRWRKFLSPRRNRLQQFNRLQVEVSRRQLTICPEYRRKQAFILTGNQLFKDLFKFSKMLLLNRQTCRSGMTTEMADQMRILFSHPFNHVADMNPLYRTC